MDQVSDLPKNESRNKLRWWLGWGVKGSKERAGLYWKKKNHKKKKLLTPESNYKEKAWWVSL